MQTSEFDFKLPSELIALRPAEPRDSARLLVLDKVSGFLKDKVFSEISDELGKNDVLVLNNSKVIPARLFGKIGEREFEVLLLKVRDVGKWESWIKPGRKAKVGDKFDFPNGLTAEIVSREEDLFILKFNLAGTQLQTKLDQIGEMPIPPYILKARGAKHEEKIDEQEYQTVYAKSLGSVAAPTAGLHFTDDLLSKLSKKGVQIEYVTLHVGLGTFQPLNTDNIEDFQIHSEYYEIDSDTAARLNEAKRAGKRIVAVGTTSVRVLESAATLKRHCEEQGDAAISAKSGETSIYIYPGYHFKFVDTMITNFHLPKSSLLLLVSAFAGQDNIQKAYQHAADEKYRFYSYGDAMLIK